MSEYITLKDNRDFSGLYRRGKSFVGPVLVTYVLKNKSDNLRFGITTGKKIGKAVRRTRSRRVIREAYYKLYPDIKKGYDFVFVARGKTPYVKSTVVYKEMKNSFCLQVFLKRDSFMKRILLAIIRFYRTSVSPLTASHCKYIPTCSQYGIEAIERFGALKGTALTVWRILRCNPFSKGGYDPVPEKSQRVRN